VTELRAGKFDFFSASSKDFSLLPKLWGLPSFLYGQREFFEEEAAETLG
jgi:hypothetical protein